MRWSEKVVGVVLIGAVAGCPGTTTYGVQYSARPDLGSTETPDDPTVEARQLLKTARTVAFYPPDYCQNTDSDLRSIGGNIADRRRVQELKSACGSLLSQMERAAEGAGYEVYSWQNLKSSSQRPIDLAKAANVDVLFEINDFEPQEVVEHTTTFFERDESRGDRPIPVSETVANKCHDYRGGSQAGTINGAMGSRGSDPTVALIGAMDVKTVSVADGRDRWHYRKSEVKLVDKLSPTTFTAPNRYNRLTQVLQGAGTGLVITGASLLLLEALLPKDPLNPSSGFDSGGWSIGLMVGGVALIGGGYGAHYALGPRSPDTKDVLCNPKFEDIDEYKAQQVFSKEEAPADVQVERLKAALRQNMLAQFVTALKELHPPGSGPAPAPAPATAPTTPAPTPAPAAPTAPAGGHP